MMKFPDPSDMAVGTHDLIPPRHYPEETQEGVGR